MANHYTGMIHDNPHTSFRDFALKCSRAFVPFWMAQEVLFREYIESHDEVEAHKNRLASFDHFIQELENITIEEAAKKVQEEYEDSMGVYCEQISRRNELLSQYDSMLNQVNEWVPPTPDHEPLKEFMAQQLMESIKWDCGDLTPPTLQSPEEWIADEIQLTREYRERIIESRKKEVERNRRNHEWLVRLHESLEEAK